MELSKRVTSGDVRSLVGSVPETLQTSIRQIGNAAFAEGFAAALLLAASIAAVTALLTSLLVRRAETLSATGSSNYLPPSAIRCARSDEPSALDGSVGLAE